jgi:hypothetical protein
MILFGACGVLTANCSLITLGQEYFRGGDGLTHVALGMFRDVHEQSRNRGGQMFSADRASFLQGRVGRAELSNALGGQREGLGKFLEERVGGNFPAAFALQGRELLLIQRPAFGIGEQAVHAACNMTELECDRWQAVRGGGKLRVAQFGAPGIHIFGGLFERVDRGARYGRHVGVGSTQPGFSRFNH